MPIESHASELTVGLSPQDALPGLSTAFDEEAMKEHLQAALFGTERTRYVVERCTPTRPLYIPGECCILRYRFQARESTSGEVLEPIVMARVFPSGSACAAYMSEKLAPLVARMRGRPEVAPFAAPAATIERLSMVIYVWPIDGELPTLVDASDRRRMIEVFRETLPAAPEPFVVEDCEIERVSYRRRQRCVLRYTVTGKTAGSREPRRLIVYGKVTAFGNEALTSRILDALRDRVGESGAGRRFAVPSSFGRPELQLLLLEPVPGEAQIGPALKARLRSEAAPGALPLEEMISTSGEVAALLHGSGVELGRRRTLDDELAGLLPEVAMARQFVPSFGARAQAWLDRIAALAAQSEPLEPCLAHGDFKHEQVLFEDSGSGLVDFDGLCQAEPALDLGKFLAHLRTEAQKIQTRAAVSSPLGEELADRFVHAYVGAAGDHVEDESRLRVRTTLYEAIALLRLALRSQQDLDEDRRDLTAALLEARLSVA